MTTNESHPPKAKQRIIKKVTISSSMVSKTYYLKQAVEGHKIINEMKLLIKYENRPNLQKKITMNNEHKNNNHWSIVPGNGYAHKVCGELIKHICERSTLLLAWDSGGKIQHNKQTIQIC